MFAIRHKDMMAMVPVVQAGVLAVYGIIIGYMLCRKLDYTDDKVYSISTIDGYKYLCAGLSVGLSCLVRKVRVVLFYDVNPCVQYEVFKIWVLHLAFMYLHLIAFASRMH